MWIFGGRNSGLFVRFGKEIEYIYIYIKINDDFEI